MTDFDEVQEDRISLPVRAFSLMKAASILLIGAVLGLLVAWMWAAPAGLLGKADAVGYAVCHRIDGRSFHLGDRQMPMCVRCSGMYLGAGVGLLLQALRKGRRGAYAPARVWVVYAALTAAFGVDGLNSYLHLIPGAPGAYEPQHWLRLLTGSGMGLVMAGVIYPSFHQTVWRDWDNRPSVSGLRDLAGMLLVVLALDALVLTENPLILFPLGLLSAAVVLMVLALVYTLIVLIMLHKENRAAEPRQLVLPLAAGFGVGLLQIVLLDALRFALTGTWGGFIFG